MSPVLLALLVGSAGGPLGGLAAAAFGALVLRRVGDWARAAVLAFAGGFILASAFLELLGRALERSHGWEVVLVLVGLAAGAAAHGGVRRLVREHEGGHGEGGGGPERGGKNGTRRAREIAWSLALVNLVEGLPIGAAFVLGTGVGLVIGALMVLENFTEGITIGTELSFEQENHRRLLLYTTAPTLTLGPGGAIAAWLGTGSGTLLAALLGAGAGIMIHVVTGSILPHVRELRHGRVPSLPWFAGILAGAGLAAIH